MKDFEEYSDNVFSIDLIKPIETNQVINFTKLRYGNSRKIIKEINEEKDKQNLINFRKLLNLNELKTKEINFGF